MAFYLDDGTEINPEDLVIPQKCLKCKNYTIRNRAVDEPDELSAEWEANVMCILTRIDQMEAEDFSCGGYIFNPKWKSNIN